MRKQKFLLINGKTALGYVTNVYRRGFNGEFDFDNKTWKFGGAFPGDHYENESVWVLVDPNNPKSNKVYDKDQWFWELQDKSFVKIVTEN